MEFTGKTVEEAKALGLEKLGITEEKAEITVIEEPVKGLFGRLKGKAVVSVKRKETDGERAVNFVQGVLEYMEIDALASLKSEGDNTVIVLDSQDSSSVIGYRGEVLDAIQTLAGAVLNIGKKDYKKVVVDCENYRDKREETLIKLAKRLEEKATEMRREVILEPMSPYERRIIHTTLSQSQTVTTRSDGKEPNRYVVIVPNDKDEFAKPYNAGRNNNDRNRRDNRGGKRFDKGGKGGKFSRGGRGGSKPAGEKKKSTISFGTYLGNSLKDN
ncbi:MAG: protein jag [Clostridia bacterium]|nr:protein jag [Clostridia bacterium]